jgi:6-phosphofructokinase 1
MRAPKSLPPASLGGITPIRRLGASTHRSPLERHGRGEHGPGFVPDDARILQAIEVPPGSAVIDARGFERAGPRQLAYFDASRTTAAIVTAGGVCPGINDVVRSIVLELRHRYGIPRVLGFRFGFAGLDPRTPHPPIDLSFDVVRDVHTWGGTFLGTSRGIGPVETIVDGLVQRKVDILFAIGGDGTMRAAHAIYGEIRRRGLPIAIVGVPKTIDNDIPFVDKTFGFDTAVAGARSAIDAAHAEARSVDRGVGLVRLMGRNAGFIAAHATLASHDVNACLVPEVPFELDGPFGLLAWLDHRLERRRHAVIVVAEGCAKSLGARVERDLSGNDRFAGETSDAGQVLRRALEGYFREVGRPITLKYIDPSYMVRAGRAAAEDAVYCDALARNAVHAAIAGKTDLMVGRWHRHFTHVALTDVLAHVKRIDATSELWSQVLESTGQPAFLAAHPPAPSIAPASAAGALPELAAPTTCGAW